MTFTCSSIAERDFGIVIDCSLNFSEHVYNTTHKANSIMAVCLSQSVAVEHQRVELVIALHSFVSSAYRNILDNTSSGKSLFSEGIALACQGRLSAF